MLYAFGDCELHVARRELHRNGKAVHVEPQVFDVLVFLIRSRDRVISKDELCEAVWAGRVVSDATLDSRIGAARQAIGDSGKRQLLLRTLPRRGFRFMGAVQEHATPEAGPTIDIGPDIPTTRTEKPSIAVLPLVNLGRDPRQEYFADGVTEDLITGLSRVRWLRVISRSTSSTYKGRVVDPKQVAGELGVRYVVAGSVRRSGPRLRIGVELADAGNAIQLWSARYNREIADIFAVQDEIVQTIVGAIEPELNAAEWERTWQKPKDRLNAWDQYRRGTWHLYRFDAANIATAKELFRAAIAADAKFAEPHAALAYASHLSLIFDQVEDRQRTLQEGLEAARKAVELDDRDSFAHAMVGRLCMTAREHDLAIEETRTAIERNPHSPQAHYGLGFALVVAGEPKKALAPLLKAVELSPRDPNLASYGTVLATAHLLLRQPAKAAEWARIATRQPASHFIAYMHLAMALAQTADEDGMQRARHKLLALKPDFRHDYIHRCWAFKRAADGVLLTEILQGMGL